VNIHIHLFPISFTIVIGQINGVMLHNAHAMVPDGHHRFPLNFSFPCPMYHNVPLSLALSPRIFQEVAKFKPDIIHATSPGIMVLTVLTDLPIFRLLQALSWFLFFNFFFLLVQIFGALAIAKMLSLPLVMSYHTHLPA
jgi:sulfoquinovosyltransferase